MLRALHVALTFLTTLPLPPVAAWQDGDARRSVRAYPLVGLLLGALLTLAWWLLSPIPADLRGVLILGLWLLLTGALHFDGFCDMADAAFASKPPEVRQQLARDPHFGVFALAAGSVLLLIKAAALRSLPHPALLLLIPTLSRTVVALPMAFYPVHGSSQLGRSARLSRAELALPLFLGGVLSLLVALLSRKVHFFWPFVLAALALTLLLARWLNRRLGGLGGDAYGALIETNEALLLIVAATL